MSDKTSQNMKLDEKSLMVFKLIMDFTEELEQIIGNKYKGLRLYNRILKKTKIGNSTAIHKNLRLFTNFCVKNREQILTQNAEFPEPKIQYSENVIINVHTIFELVATDSSTVKTTWQYLLTFSALLDPESNAKEVLQKVKSSSPTPSDNTDNKSTEKDFITGIISKIEKNVGANPNPAQIMQTVLQDGVISDILGGLDKGVNNGDFNVNGLLSSVQSMISNLGDQTKDDPDAKKAVGMLSSVSGMLSSATSGDGAPPDLSGMLSMMTSMMGSMGGMGGTTNSNDDKNNE